LCQAKGEGPEDRTERNFSDASLYILLSNSKNTLILQGCKHYFTLHVIYLLRLGGYSVLTRALKLSLKVFGAYG
jgi:hypothetical protein